MSFSYPETGRPDLVLAYDSYLLSCIPPPPPLNEVGIINIRWGRRIFPITATTSYQNCLHNHRSLGFARPVHTIHLSALRDHYSAIEADVACKSYLVIRVIKADGYWEGLSQTAMFLTDVCGSDTFAIQESSQRWICRHHGESGGRGWGDGVG